MIFTTLTHSLVATAMLIAGGAHYQATDSLQADAKRFYRPADGYTIVDGFVKVPFEMLTSLPGSGGAAYRLELAVTDAAGLELTRTDWTGQVPANLLNVAGASTVEHFTFAVPAGTYGVNVTVVDSASGAPSVASLSLEGYAERPFASDLLLTNSMRRAAAPGDSPAPGEIQKGSYFLSGTPKPILSPSDANLYYYIEHYPGRDVSISAKVRVNTGERNLVETPPSEIPLNAAGGIMARELNLTGLPPGDYEIELQVDYPDTTFVRSAAFEVGAFRETQDVAQNDPFAFMTEASLDSLFNSMVHLPFEDDERGVYRNLSVDGKRNFMRRFWERRDPTPGTPENEFQARYFGMVAEANRRYGEGGASGIPGWRTDRGRIFLKYGEPDDFLQRPSTGRNPPYVVWKYTRGRPLKFLFIDQSGFGNWELMYTDDRSETTRGDWQSFLEAESVQEVLNF